MKKFLCIFFSAILLLQACALAELDEEELLIEETVEGEEGFGTYETPEEPAAEAPFLPGRWEWPVRTGQWAWPAQSGQRRPPR